MVICLERGADLHITQLVPLPLNNSCSSKSRLVLPEWLCFSGAGLPRLSWKKRLLNECSSSSSWYVCSFHSAFCAMSLASGL